MKLKLTSLTLFAALAFAPNAHADAFTDASNAFCERMKSCAAAEMGAADDMSDEMKAQMNAMLDGMCAQMQAPFDRIRQFDDLIDSAAQCMNSMAAMSCEALDDADLNSTSECRAYEQEAAKYE